jgi:hypothetical protein
MSVDWRTYDEATRASVATWLPRAIESSPQQLGRITIHSIDLDEQAIVVRFSVDWRAGCTYGWRFPAHPVGEEPPEWDPDSWTGVVIANLLERIEGDQLPTCTPDAVTWISDPSWMHSHQTSLPASGPGGALRLVNAVMIPLGLRSEYHVHSTTTVA